MIVYKNETYKKNYIDENINPTSTFTKQNETKILYSQYCNEKWNIRIHNDGKQSLLILKSKKAVKQLKHESTIVQLIPEFCIMISITNFIRTIVIHL